MSGQGSGVIVASLVGATGITYINTVTSNKTTTIKPVIGMFILGTGLFGIAMWNTDIAKSLAVLIFVTSLVMNGGPVFKAVGKITS